MTAPAPRVSDGLDPHTIERIHEVVAEGDGCWRTCSGCHNTEDGYDIGHYPHSDTFGCQVGSGCSECGGLGVIWDTTDYEDMARWILASDAANTKEQP